MLILVGCGGTVASSTDQSAPAAEWATYGQNQARTFFNGAETRITSDNVAKMRWKWRYLTGAIVTAAAHAAYVDVPGAGRIKVVFVSSWDGNFYALRATNGSRLWSYTFKPQPGASFPAASSAEITTVGGEQRVYVGAGMTVYCFAASTGALRWQFDAGTGCTNCDYLTERNEVESSPAVVDGRVFFGMDINEGGTGKGGAYAVDAFDGHLIWYFDVQTGATCRPSQSDVRRFDGYHTAAQLGLPDTFFASNPGCDFDRQGDQCGNIWSSFSVDPARKVIYTVTANCPTVTTPPMPQYDEALIALTYDGAPRWSWRPREIDTADLDLAGVPNLFATVLGGASRDVIGVGGKDGTYHLLDRDGVNVNSGRIEPYWSTNVVPGGPAGGIIGSAAIGNGQVFFSTAVGSDDVTQFQQPSAWDLLAGDGSIVWSNRRNAPSFAPTTATPSVVFMGGVFGQMVAHGADTGAILSTFSVGGPLASAAVILDGEVFVGAGTGERGAPLSDAAYIASLTPSYVNALCLPDSPDCPGQLCDDGNPCTYDFSDGGVCRSEPGPDTIPCQTNGQAGMCQAGTCVALPAATPTAPS